MKDNPALTAHLCATAVVAACRSYGDHPLRALEAKRGHLKRGVSVAALAVVQATGSPVRRVEALFRLQASTLARSRRNAGEAHGRALTAALVAIGGAQLVLAPTPPARERRPDPGTVSGKPDRLLEPNPVRVVDLGVATPVDVPALASPAPDPTPEPQQPPPRSPDLIGRAPEARPAAPPEVAPRRSAAVADVPVRRSGGAPKVFGRLNAAPPPAAPTKLRDTVSDSDRALIEAAIAAGKVKKVQKDDGTELVYDPDRHTYARYPRAELELVPGHGWRKAPGSRGLRGAAANARNHELAKAVAGS